jgi:hypothetical protein
VNLGRYAGRGRPDGEGMPGGARTDTVNGTYYVVMHADIAIGGTSATA